MLSIPEEHSWRSTVQGISDAMLDFCAGRSAALGEITALIRKLQGIYQIEAPTRMHSMPLGYPRGRCNLR